MSKPDPNTGSDPEKRPVQERRAGMLGATGMGLGGTAMFINGLDDQNWVLIPVGGLGLICGVIILSMYVIQKGRGTPRS